MSQYCTEADLLGEIQPADLVSLTDDSVPPLGIVGEDVLASTIASSSGIIDRYVGNIYAVPFGDPAPPSVRSLCITITCYKLYRRREVPDEKNKFTEEYRDAIAFLQAVNKRDATLDLSVSPAVPMVAVDVTPTIFGSGNIPASTR